MPHVCMNPSMRPGVVRCRVVAKGHMARPAPAKNRGAMHCLTRMTARTPITSVWRASGPLRPPARMLAAQGLEVGPVAAKLRVLVRHPHIISREKFRPDVRMLVVLVA